MKIGQQDDRSKLTLGVCFCESDFSRFCLKTEVYFRFKLHTQPTTHTNYTSFNSMRDRRMLNNSLDQCCHLVDKIIRTREKKKKREKVHVHSAHELLDIQKHDCTCTECMYYADDVCTIHIP